MIHPSVKIHPTARINCNHLTILSGGVVGANCVIEGNSVIIGHDLWMDEGAVIGGGSCYDPVAHLVAGNWLHMGRGSQINIARGVTIESEVGIGIQTQIFTHGAYLDEMQGFPVQFAPVAIGSNVWLPNAWVNPGVTFGNNIVVAARSLVNKDLPSGCLAAGAPAKVIKENIYPRKLTEAQRKEILLSIRRECQHINSKCSILYNDEELITHGAVFNCVTKIILGSATPFAELVRNQLRRHGIRFPYSVESGQYVRWN